jgi:hypothetical protein
MSDFIKGESYLTATSKLRLDATREADDTYTFTATKDGEVIKVYTKQTLSELIGIIASVTSSAIENGYRRPTINDILGTGDVSAYINACILSCPEIDNVPIFKKDE